MHRGDRGFPPDPVAVDGSTWISYNVYTQAQDAMLRQVVAPALAELLGGGLARSFFFIRYFDELGPHLRVRLGIERGAIRDADRGFVTAVRERSRRPAEVASNLESEDAVPEGLLRPSAIELEVERYGGARAFSDAVRFFGVSSVHALDFVDHYHAQGAVKRMMLAMSLLLWQALGFARDLDELHGLLDYFRGRREEMAAVVAGADQAFDRDPESWCEVFRRAVRVLTEARAEAASGAGSAAALARASRALSESTAVLDRSARVALAGSQMHMTANRIGLGNRQECYASQLLCRSARALESGDPRLWNAVRETVSRAERGRGRTGTTLAEQLDEHLGRFVAAWRARENASTRPAARPAG